MLGGQPWCRVDLGGPGHRSGTRRACIVAGCTLRHTSGGGKRREWEQRQRREAGSALAICEVISISGAGRRPEPAGRPLSWWWTTRRERPPPAARSTAGQFRAYVRREPEEPDYTNAVSRFGSTKTEAAGPLSLSASGKTSVGPGKALSSWPHSWFFVAVSLHPASPAPRPRCKLNDNHFSRRHRDTTDQPAPALLAMQRPAEFPSVLDAGPHRHILPAGPDRQSLAMRPRSCRDQQHTN
jgi:hypothetical protein